MSTSPGLRPERSRNQIMTAVGLIMAVLASIAIFVASPVDALEITDDTCYEQVEVEKHRWTRAFGGEKQVQGYEHVGPGLGENGTEWADRDDSNWYTVPPHLNPPSMGQVARTGSVNLSSYNGPNRNVPYQYPDTGVDWFPSEHGWATQEEFEAGASGMSWQLVATETFTENGPEVPCPEADLCDPNANPGPGSIAKWLTGAKYGPSDCFAYEVEQECGALDVQFTRNDTPYTYSFRWVEGDTVPDDYTGDGGFPATWAEDYNGGSVEVTFYIVGPESDYFEGHDFPNWWDREGETVTVDTDCEDPPRNPPPPPTTDSDGTTTTTTEPGITTTTEDVEVGGIDEEVDEGTGSGGAELGGTTLPRTGAGSGAMMLVAGLVLALGAVMRTASRRFS